MKSNLTCCWSAFLWPVSINANEMLIYAAEWGVSGVYLRPWHCHALKAFTLNMTYIRWNLERVLLTFAAHEMHKRLSLVSLALAQLPRSSLSSLTNKNFKWTPIHVLNNEIASIFLAQLIKSFANWILISFRICVKACSTVAPDIIGW